MFRLWGSARATSAALGGASGDAPGMAWGGLCRTGEEFCSLGLTYCQTGFAWELDGQSMEDDGCLGGVWVPPGLGLISC